MYSNPLFPVSYLTTTGVRSSQSLITLSFLRLSPTAGVRSFRSCSLRHRAERHVGREQPRCGSVSGTVGPEGGGQDRRRGDSSSGACYCSGSTYIYVMLHAPNSPTSIAHPAIGFEKYYYCTRYNVSPIHNPIRRYLVNVTNKTVQSTFDLKMFCWTPPWLRSSGREKKKGLTNATPTRLRGSQTMQVFDLTIPLAFKAEAVVDKDWVKTVQVR